MDSQGTPMNFLTVPERLLTWLDVERVFKQETALWTKMPQGVHSVRCFSDGMDVTHSASTAEIHAWLTTIFKQAFDSTNCTVRLRIGDHAYQVNLELVAPVNTIGLPTYPLWRDVTYLQDLQNSGQSNGLTLDLPLPWGPGPRMVSFHSFKGGVGRTTALMTYVAALLQGSDSKPIKILVVDADLEAPGVTFWLDTTNRPQVSFVHFLEAMHYPPVSVENSLDFFVQALRKTSLNVGGTNRELFVLPAALNLAEIQDMPVLPSHLASNPQNPWVLTDRLHTLGRKLEVDAVFVDLRAGLSELASPVLFDPRVEHFFVTTVARQSVEGMAEVLTRLHAFNSRLPRQDRGSAMPSVVLSMLTDQLRKSEEYKESLNTLGLAYPAIDDQPMSQGLEWLEVEFSEPLMSVSSLRRAFEVLKQSSLYKSAQEWAQPLQIPAQGANLVLPTLVLNDRANAKALLNVCTRVQFAEKDTSADMLVTEPLRNLAKHFSTEVPNLVSVGAKGAGKTFTFLQVCRARTWHSFMQKVGVEPAGVSNALIFPGLWSKNLDTGLRRVISEMRTTCLTQLQKTITPQTESEISRGIELATTQPPNHWDDFWSNFICSQFGMPGGTFSELNEHLASIEKSVLVMVDGLEDAFFDPSSEISRAAINSLLMLPNRLDELVGRHIGVLVFVRADYVQAAIRQNVAQFLGRYAPFKLEWNPESFLRLAYWLCALSGIVDNSDSQAETLLLENLLTKLEPLWGKKLGNDNSKEAHSARWVFSSLCDLKGNIQARDLVRFLKFSSEIEIGRTGETWPSRILAPESMRKAIPKCSFEKVEEAAKEIAPLKEWIDQLHNVVERRLVPFSAANMMLLSKDLIALQELGVIYEDTQVPVTEPRLYLPEIYRTGLGFDTSVSGRPRTQALLKSNLGTLPF